MTKPKQPGKPKRIRIRFTEFQLKGLMEFYQQNSKDCSKLSKPDYVRMGEALGLAPQHVQAFINNRRHHDIAAGKRPPKRLQKDARSVHTPERTSDETAEQGAAGAQPYYIQPTDSCDPILPASTEYCGAVQYVDEESIDQTISSLDGGSEAVTSINTTVTTPVTPTFREDLLETSISSQSPFSKTYPSIEEAMLGARLASLEICAFIDLTQTPSAAKLAQPEHFSRRNGGQEQGAKCAQAEGNHMFHPERNTAAIVKQPTPASITHPSHNSHVLTETPSTTKPLQIQHSSPRCDDQDSGRNFQGVHQPQVNAQTDGNQVHPWTTASVYNPNEQSRPAQITNPAQELTDIPSAGNPSQFRYPSDRFGDQDNGRYLKGANYPPNAGEQAGSAQTYPSCGHNVQMPNQAPWNTPRQGAHGFTQEESNSVCAGNDKPQPAYITHYQNGGRQNIDKNSLIEGSSNAPASRGGVIPAMNEHHVQVANQGQWNALRQGAHASTHYPNGWRPNIDNNLLRNEGSNSPASRGGVIPAMNEHHVQTANQAHWNELRQGAHGFTQRGDSFVCAGNEKPQSTYITSPSYGCGIGAGANHHYGNRQNIDNDSQRNGGSDIPASSGGTMNEHNVQVANQAHWNAPRQGEHGFTQGGISVRPGDYIPSPSFGHNIGASAHHYNGSRQNIDSNSQPKDSGIRAFGGGAIHAMNEQLEHRNGYHFAGFEQGNGQPELVQGYYYPNNMAGTSEYDNE
ncbi:unnamed protein product [Hermetia illucens]|uniref:Homeobox domain-containing protein n=1 Tax=Hermetia illucens TaxID=343691 RepID=A0A7R8YV64_HERIL|nr:unnamed protein product [Hermetia illucens]